MIISIHKKDRYSDSCHTFDGDEYIVDLDRPFGGHQKGDLICQIHPFSWALPLQLRFAIRKNGDLVFRAWEWDKNINPYLHTFMKPQDLTVTPEQIDTVNGLFSGRIRFEGLKIAVGASVQDICPIDVAKEEKLIGKKIYFNRR